MKSFAAAGAGIVALLAVAMLLSAGRSQRWRILGRTLQAVLLAGGACMLSTGCREGDATLTAYGDLYSTAESTAHLLELDQDAMDLGRIDASSPRTANFNFRNVTDAPVRLHLGKPSCGCVDAKLFPREMLQPGESGRLVLTLAEPSTDVGKRLPGQVLERVLMSAEPVEEDAAPPQYCTFEAKGYVEGAVGSSREYSYVAEATFPPPPLEFMIITGGAPESVHVESAESDLAGVRLRASDASISGPHRRPGEGFIQWKVSVPVDVGGVQGLANAEVKCRVDDQVFAYRTTLALLSRRADGESMAPGSGDE